MPIDLITGLPGNAKTLFALQLLIDRATKEQRPVYYDGLKEFKADDPRLNGTSWIQFDSSKWHDEVPNGSLIFVDEAQKIFRARNMGATPPKYVTELEEHRHRGIDFVMVTQHPRLIDPAVKVLTQTHRHMVRIEGWEMSTVHRWESIKADPEKPTSRKDSEKTKWSFAKDLYGLYKSADEHTFKKRIPPRLKMLVGLAVVFVALVAFMVYFLKKKVSTSDPAPAAISATSPGAQRNGVNVADVLPPGDRPQTVDPIEDAKAFAASYTPRVEGLPHTAPRYDAITVPVRAPVPAMCVQVGTVKRQGGPDCRCYSQDGTAMHVGFNMCMEFANDGRFQDFEPDPGKRQERVERSQAVLAAREEPGYSDRVVSFPGVPDVPQIQGRAMR